jgi:hypothetical protein
VQSIKRLIAVLVAMLVIGVVWRAVAAGRLAPRSIGRFGAITLTALGLASLILGILPLAGLLAMLLGIGLLVRSLFVAQHRAMR